MKSVPPLRKFVSVCLVKYKETGKAFYAEKLECGHIVVPGANVIGNAERRHCAECVGKKDPGWQRVARRERGIVNRFKEGILSPRTFRVTGVDFEKSPTGETVRYETMECGHKKAVPEEYGGSGKRVCMECALRDIERLKKHIPNAGW